MKITYAIICLLFGITSCSQPYTVVVCNSAKTTQKDGNSATGGKGEIAYTVAEHYFLRNDVKSLPPFLIETQEQFDSYFGMATVMGEGGQPTKIDFTRSYVVAITTPATDTYTEILPQKLKRNSCGDIVLSYKLKKGQQLSYTMQPLMLLVANRE